MGLHDFLGVVGGIFGFLFFISIPAIVGIVFTSLHNHARSQRALMISNVSHKSSRIMSMRSINPVFFAYAFAIFVFSFNVFPYVFK